MHRAKIQKMGLTVKKSLMELAVLWACLEQTCLPGRSWEGLCIASFILRWALGRDTALTPLESTACNPRAPYVAEQLLRIRGVQTLHWKALWVYPGELGITGLSPHCFQNAQLLLHKPKAEAGGHWAQSKNKHRNPTEVPADYNSEINITEWK